MPSRMPTTIVPSAANVEHDAEGAGPPVHGELLDDHRDADGVLGTEEHAAGELEEREGPDVPADRRERGEQGVAHDRPQQHRPSAEPVREAGDEEGHEQTELDGDAGQAQRRLAHAERALDVRQEQGEDRAVVALEERRRHQQDEQKPQVVVVPRQLRLRGVADRRPHEVGGHPTDDRGQARIFLHARHVLPPCSVTIV